MTAIYWGSRFGVVFASTCYSVEQATRQARCDQNQGEASFIAIEVDGRIADVSAFWNILDDAEDAEYASLPKVVATTQLQIPDVLQEKYGNRWATVGWYHSQIEATETHAKWIEMFGYRVRLKTLK